MDSNENGNSNWNRNGNSNWNRNGNSNWNRNGNSNWNRNWNRNGNSNWNRNWNRNWNKNWNYNQNYNRRVPGLGLFSFAYPRFALDASRITISGGNGGKYDATFLNFRASVINKPRKKGHKIVYNSSYMMSYSYSDTSTSGTKHRLNITDNHRWKRFSLNNSWHYEKDESRTGYLVTSSAAYHNTFTIKKQPIGYRTGVDADYRQYNGVKSWGATGFFWTQTSKSKRLMPGLVSRSSVTVELRRKQNKAGDNDNIYSVGLRENLRSTQLKHTTIDAGFSTGYSESGVPFDLTVSAVYSRSYRFSLAGGYGVSYFFHKEHRGGTIHHRAWANASYLIKPNLKFKGGITYGLQHTKNGITDSSSHTEITGHLAWRINSRSRADFETRYEFGDSGFATRFTVSADYSNQIHRNGSLFVHAHYTGSGLTGGGEKVASVGYSMSYRKLSFTASYKLTIDAENNNAHELNITASRSFGRTFNRLW
jgi:hypothetical protein